jgi:3-dehydroquinate synthetase
MRNASPRILKLAGLPTNLNAMKAHICATPRRCSASSAQDKKVTRGALNFILTRGIGQSFIARDVPESEVRSFLVEKIGVTGENTWKSGSRRRIVLFAGRPCRPSFPAPKRR